MAEMEVCDDPLEIKKCIKCNNQLLDNLNVAYSGSNSLIILWNKYQLFLYENLNFDDATRIFIPEFIVFQIIIVNNYLLCLDCSGNIHVISLKFKTAGQKRLKTSFQPREQSIMAFVQRKNEHILSLKLECGTYFLCLNKVNTEFSKEKKIAIKYDGDSWPLTKTTQENYLIKCFTIPEHDVNVKQMFNLQESIYKDYDIVLVSFDKLDIFACLFSPNMSEDEIKLMKLYACPSEICDIQIIELEEEINAIIALTSGTIIKLPFVKTTVEPVPIHLNTAVSKFYVNKETIIYTDGASMWKTEKSFSKEIKFSQFFIRHVKDFITFGDQMLCTTYSGLIYLFIFDDESCYLKPIEEPYCPVGKLLNNSEYLFNLLEEAEKNNDFVNSVHIEGTYITALALANRPDLMNTILENNIVVYEHYEDAIKETSEITLTEEHKEYFKTESVYLLVEITTLQMEHLVNEVLAQLFCNSKIHISLFAEHKLLKTNSIQTTESLKKVCVLIPLDRKQICNASAVKASIQIVSHIPGAFDAKEPVWITLYHKEINLNSEHFFKTDLISIDNISLKGPQETMEDLILKAAITKHSMFKFTDISKIKSHSLQLSMFVKLPTDYIEILRNPELFTDQFHSRKERYLSELLTSEEFLKSRSNLILEVGDVQVDIEIVADEVSGPVLKIASDNVATALNIRNFFAKLFYNDDDFKTHIPVTEFINYPFYTRTENLKKAIQDAVKRADTTELHVLIELFQKTVVGGLPI